MPLPGVLQSYASSLAAHRVMFYSVFSIGAVAAVIANALRRHSNFYSMAVYLSRSNGTIVVMANFGILLALLAGRLLQQVFFGPLRATEVERLYDRMWFFVTESLLAFTIFREEFDIPFAVMFGFLLFIKCFHWLLSDRIEWMDQRPWPGPPLLFHIRIQLLMGLLWLIDLLLFMFMVENMISSGVGGSVLFASEYAILLASLANSAAKYFISVIDIRRASVRGGENAPPWEDKSMIVFYVEIVTDFVKLVTYMTFFMLVLTFYGLPLNIVRDVYVTARSFIIRFRDLLRYRSATRNMDERYPNATETDLHATSDRTCIICRDEMVPHATSSDGNNGGEPAATENPQSQQGPNMTPKKLPCGHIFHFYCLRSWLERQQSCPTCRRSVLESQAQVNRPQGPRRAQPEAVPQEAAQNPLNRQQDLQWQMQNMQGNNAGILRRLIAAANVAAENGVDVHAQYAGLNRPGQPPLQVPPYHHQPFAGFFGPDGLWHAWPQPEAQEHATQHTPIPTTTDSNAPPSQQPTTTSEGTTASSAPSTTATSPEEHDPQKPSPREAARAAALRRFGPLQTPVDETHLPQTQSEDAEKTSRDLAGSSTHDQVLENHTENMQPQSTLEQVPPSSHGASPSLPHPRAPIAPAFIPLFDPRLNPSPATARLASVSPLRSFRYGPILPPAPSSAPLRELPPIMTDEQLRSMDRLTREAIDARLRVLDNIQQAAARMSEELLRCRSVFPPLQPDASLNMAEPRRTEEGSSSVNVEGDT